MCMYVQYLVTLIFFINVILKWTACVDENRFYHIDLCLNVFIICISQNNCTHFLLHAISLKQHIHHITGRAEKIKCVCSFIGNDKNIYYHYTQMLRIHGRDPKHNLGDTVSWHKQHSNGTHMGIRLIVVGTVGAQYPTTTSLSNKQFIIICEFHSIRQTDARYLSRTITPQCSNGNITLLRDAIIVLIKFNNQILALFWHVVVASVCCIIGVVHASMFRAYPTFNSSIVRKFNMCVE